MIFLSSTQFLKNVVDNINKYFDKGYEIEKILNMDCGYYIILVLKCNNIYKSTTVSDIPEYKYTLIEEIDNPDRKWVSTSTNDDKNAIIKDSCEPEQNWIRASNEEVKVS